MKMQLDREKLKALVHYICERAENPDELGSIKLNKVLWYSDSISYLISGSSITGETYIKRQFGPVPKDICQIKNELVEERKIARGKKHYFGHLKDEYIAIEDADPSSFTAKQIDLINTCFEHVCKKNTATSISDETHDDIWAMAEIGEEIPLFTIFAATLGEINEHDMLWANQKVNAIEGAHGHSAANV